MTKTLAPDDIRDFLNRFASAIMRDQIYVDELPRRDFTPNMTATCGVNGVSTTWPTSTRCA